MFDDPRSHEADDLALQAELLERRGEHAGAGELYRWAAALEEALAREAPASSPRQLGVLAISAVSLWGAAGALEQAIRLADEFLTHHALPANDRTSLAKLAEELRTRAAQAYSHGSQPT